MVAPSEQGHAEIARWAAPQGGVVSRQQLLSIGWTDRRTDAQLRAHRWVRLLPGVYNTVTGEPDVVAWWWAAHFYAGDSSRLARHSALQAWGVRSQELPVEVAIPGTRRIRNPPEQLVVQRCWATRPARAPRGCPPAIEVEHALLDVVAEVSEEQAVVDLVTNVGQHRRFRLRSFERALARRGHYRHRALLTSLIAEIGGGATTTLEVVGVRRILRAHGLPEGRGQVREFQDGATLLRDRVLEPFGVVLEFDGRRGHADPRGRFRDFRRDNAVAIGGRIPLRFGWDDVHQNACECASQVAAALTAVGWRASVQTCGPRCRALRVA